MTQLFDWLKRSAPPERQIFDPNVELDPSQIDDRRNEAIMAGHSGYTDPSVTDTYQDDVAAGRKVPKLTPDYDIYENSPNAQQARDRAIPWEHGRQDPQDLEDNFQGADMEQRSRESRGITDKNTYDPQGQPELPRSEGPQRPTAGDPSAWEPVYLRPDGTEWIGSLQGALIQIDKQQQPIAWLYLG